VAFQRAQGDLRLVERANGQKVWEFRWWQTRIDGSKKRPKIVIGTLEEYPSEAAAQRAVDALRITINEQTPRQQLEQISVATLVGHYRQHELPDIFYKTPPQCEESEEDEERKTYSTQETYEGYLKKWILPRWGSYRLVDVKAIQVEQWLKTLPLARGSKTKIRNIMSALYSHAIRWEWTDRNPITHVRQSAKRSKTPTVLSIPQIQTLLLKIKDPCRLAWFLDATSGLRVGELLALKWEDINFETLDVNVTRSIRKQRIGRCKTEISRKPLPLAAELAEMLWSWKLKTPYNRPNDWVFARPHKKGKQPFWPGSLFRAHVMPALKDAGITAPVGWHTLRHTFGTLMKANGKT
jgi:integrase